MGFVKEELAEENQVVKGVISSRRMIFGYVGHYRSRKILSFSGIKLALNYSKDNIGCC
jgi:hypothetical protein